MKLPNGPRTPALVQVLQWALRPTNFLDDCAKRFGRTFTIKLPGSKATVFVSHPEALEQIFSAPVGAFNSSEASEIFQPIVGKHSLMVLDGRQHQRQRKLLMPPFHGDRLRVYAQLIGRLTEQMMDRWQPGDEISLKSSMRDISLEVMLQAVFGITEGENLEILRHKFVEMEEMATSPIFAIHLFVRKLQKDLGTWSPWGKFVRLRKEVDRIVYAEIAERQRNPEPGRTDILTLMMAARDEEGQLMTDAELRDEMMTLLLTGQDTIAVGLTWALYWIHRLPRVQQRLVEELSTLSDRADMTAITQLPYLSAVCQETLRYYPVIMASLPRLVKTPFKVLGYEFPVGTQIFPDIYSAHQNEEIYPEPKEFRPERFLERQYSSFEYCPFGGGNRRCVGFAFAPFQMKLVLAAVLSRYQLALADPRPIQPVRHGPGLAPSRDVKLRVVAPVAPIEQQRV
ncbi:cytochrome P450 [Trichocoleus sp. FACHB-262]|uniref:cytochrome P450 n=1 Tax=Trichocoleus sp. FACHB-262 TaxID=2692869 RepID=UPI001683755E|nr:cytochrome P450 [Trichocoleus sp. FACHB-262]MBD2124588.1 cytochrome P450 [Trichocoleus sp. FACHB-262]